MNRGYFVLFVLFAAHCCMAQNEAIKPYATELFPQGISGSVCGFSKDGRTIYFTREDTALKKTFIYQATRKGKLWTNVKRLSFSGKYNDYGGRLSSDGLIFYFTSDRPGANNKTDDAWNIWMSQKDGDEWLSPKPINEINSTGNECCPLPLADGSLLFSADRGERNRWLIYQSHNGLVQTADSINNFKAWQWPSFITGKNNLLIFNSMLRPDTKGMDDIYISRMDKNGKWVSVVNIGMPLNTKEFEDGAILSPDNKWLIFCRHATPESPSRVLYTAWKPIRIKLQM
jgi:WD40-like Beta Propeller Repeat